jgi:putative IMPACT (imprinted ancient) family translation regulator
MPMDIYFVPAGTQTFELEIKKSRFITSVTRISSQTAGKQFVQKTRETYPTASHHCWAYIAGKPDDTHQYNQSDDREPKGTAGKPMLILDSSVDSRKSAQALDAPGKLEKRLITNKVSTHFSNSLCTPIP